MYPGVHDVLGPRLQRCLTLSGRALGEVSAPRYRTLENRGSECLTLPIAFRTGGRLMVSAFPGMCHTLTSYSLMKTTGLGAAVSAPDPDSASTLSASVFPSAKWR